MDDITLVAIGLPTAVRAAFDGSPGVLLSGSKLAPDAGLRTGVPLHLVADETHPLALLVISLGDIGGGDLTVAEAEEDEHSGRVWAYLRGNRDAVAAVGRAGLFQRYVRVEERPASRPVLPDGVAWNVDEIRYDDGQRARVAADVFFTRSGRWKWAAEAQPYVTNLDSRTLDDRVPGKARKFTCEAPTEAGARGDCERWIVEAWKVAYDLKPDTALRQLEAELVGVTRG